MDRLVLSDAAWEGMAPLIIGRPDQKGSTGRDGVVTLPFEERERTALYGFSSRGDGLTPRGQRRGA
jgi:hypothetical protein